MPRRAFIPDLIWQHGTANGGWGLIPRHRADDPDGWLSAAYRDDSVITQVDDGEPRGPEGIGVLASSSASMPTVVAAMLRALDVHDRCNVLEIGTGTGYNAALLAHRLGAHHVTSVEIDPTVTDAAHHALKRVGYHGITVVTADGAQGFPPRAPYDRVLSLAVAADGTAAGRIVDRTWFMQLRDQRLPQCSVADVVRGDYHGERSTTTIGPYELAGHRGAMLAIGQRVLHCHHKYFSYDPDEGAGELWFLDPWSGSWASHVHVTPDCGDDEFSVRQRGPRRLWDEVRAAHTWWTEQGCPDEQDWVFTVTATQQHLVLKRKARP